MMNKKNIKGLIVILGSVVTFCVIVIAKINKESASISTLNLSQNPSVQEVKSFFSDLSLDDEAFNRILSEEYQEGVPFYSVLEPLLKRLNEAQNKTLKTKGDIIDEQWGKLMSSQVPVG